MGATDFLTATLEARMPGVCDAVSKEITFLNAIKRKGRIQYNKGGQSIKFMVRYTASGLALPISDYSPMTVKTAKTLIEVETQWRAYAATIGLSRFQRDRNKNAGDAKLVDMLDHQLNEVQESFMETLGDHINDDATAVGAAGEVAMDGLDNIVDDDNTYCALDRTDSTYAWWQSQSNAVTGSFDDDDDLDGVSNGMDALYTGYLSAMSAEVSTGGGVGKKPPRKKAEPDMIITTKTAYQKYLTQMLPQQRYTNGGTNDPGAKIAFHGLPVEWDTYSTADKWRFLNMKWFELWVVGGQLLDVESMGGLPPTGQPRMQVWDITTQLQLFCRQPRFQVQVTGVDS